MVSLSVVMIIVAICGIVLSSVSLTAYSGTNPKPMDQNWGFSIFALVFSILLCLGGVFMIGYSYSSSFSSQSVSPQINQVNTQLEKAARAANVARNESSRASLLEGLAHLAKR
jgi:NADH:ubiquinone oxidoreductase subunit 6 (subunit J)